MKLVLKHDFRGTFNFKVCFEKKKREGHIGRSSQSKTKNGKRHFSFIYVREAKKATKHFAHCVALTVNKR